MPYINNQYVPIGEGEIGPGNVPANTSQGTSAVIFVQVPNDSTNAIQIQSPDDNWTSDAGGSPQPYGQGQAIILYRAGTGGPTAQAIWRVDGSGNQGMGGNFHLATGTHNPVAQGSNFSLWVDLTNTNNTTQGIVITPSAAQSANLMTLQRPGGITALAAIVNGSAGLDFATYADNGTTGAWTVASGSTPPFNIRMSFAAQGAAEIPIFIKLAASATGQPLLIQNSGATAVFSILASGQFQTAAANEATTATAGAATLPANPVGFILFQDHTGTTRKLPYYAN